MIDVLAHNGKILIHPTLTPIKRTKWFVPTASRHIGCVVLDTAKHLRVSVEAMALMKKIPRGQDSMGDISWWAVSDGTHAFSWIGAIFRVIDPESSESDRDFFPHEGLPHTVIPNIITAEMVAGLVNHIEDGETFMWQEPFSL